MGINRQGKRQQVRESNKRVKKHKQEFFKILKELNDIAPNVRKDFHEIKDKENFNDEDLTKLINKYSDIKVDKLELMVMKGKLWSE